MDGSHVCTAAWRAQRAPHSLFWPRLFFHYGAERCRERRLSKHTLRERTDYSLIAQPKHIVECAQVVSGRGSSVVVEPRVRTVIKQSRTSISFTNIQRDPRTCYVHKAAKTHSKTYVCEWGDGEKDRRVRDRLASRQHMSLEYLWGWSLGCSTSSSVTIFHKIPQSQFIFLHYTLLLFRKNIMFFLCIMLMQVPVGCAFAKLCEYMIVGSKLDWIPGVARCCSPCHPSSITLTLNIFVITRTF